MILRFLNIYLDWSFFFLRRRIMNTIILSTESRSGLAWRKAPFQAHSRLAGSLSVGTCRVSPTPSQRLTRKGPNAWKDSNPQEEGPEARIVEPVRDPGLFGESAPAGGWRFIHWRCQPTPNMVTSPLTARLLGFDLHKGDRAWICARKRLDPLIDRCQKTVPGHEHRRVTAILHYRKPVIEARDARSVQCHCDRANLGRELVDQRYGSSDRQELFPNNMILRSCLYTGQVQRGAQPETISTSPDLNMQGALDQSSWAANETLY